MLDDYEDDLDEIIDGAQRSEDDIIEDEMKNKDESADRKRAASSRISS